jgi:hypothetical protein
MAHLLSVWRAQVSQLRRYVQLIIASHGVEEERHASTTISGFTQGVVDFSRCNNGFRISGSHPVDRGVDVMIGDLSAVADYHLAVPGAGHAVIHGRCREYLTKTVVKQAVFLIFSINLFLGRPMAKSGPQDLRPSTVKLEVSNQNRGKISHPAE